MELSFAFFADSAVALPDGKFYCLGGGYSLITLAQIPSQANVVVVAGFRFGATDAGRTHNVEMRLVDADGRLVLSPATMQFQSAGTPPPRDREVAVQTVTTLAPMFGEPGAYRVEFWSEGRPLGAVRLSVEQGQPVPDLGGRPN